MNTYKTIFSGQLEFGSERSFEKVLGLFEHRKENYYRNEIIFKAEDVFDADTHCLKVPRLIAQTSDKSWKNTINLLEYLSQYAIAGDFRAWRTSEGKMIDSRFIEPNCDKVAVQAYLQGRELINESGKEEEAKAALNRAIDKFARHSKAYERRGKVNYQLGNYKDALYDYTKSIDINPNAPFAYLGRAFVHIQEGNFAKAIPDLEMTCKRSIPHQSVYWQARRLKGECHLELEEFDKAIFEFKLFIQRKSQPNDENSYWRRKVYGLYGIALVSTGQYLEAIESFNAALEPSPEVSSETSQAENLLYRGIARQKAGENGFTNDWKEAAGLGSERAAELLAEHA